MSSSNRPIVQHKNLSLTIKGTKTDLVICSYEDHYLLPGHCNSNRKHGHATSRQEEGVSTEPTYHVSVIFGKRDEPMLTACARQLIEHISSCDSSRSLVLSLGLKDHSAETLKGIVTAAIENRLW